MLVVHFWGVKKWPANTLLWFSWLCFLAWAMLNHQQRIFFPATILKLISLWPPSPGAGECKKLKIWLLSSHSIYNAHAKAHCVSLLISYIFPVYCVCCYVGTTTNAVADSCFCTWRNAWLTGVCMKSCNEFISLTKYSFKPCRPFSNISHAKS